MHTSIQYTNYCYCEGIDELIQDLEHTEHSRSSTARTAKRSLPTPASLHYPVVRLRVIESPRRSAGKEDPPQENATCHHRRPGSCSPVVGMPTPIKAMSWPGGLHEKDRLPGQIVDMFGRQT